MLVLAVSAAACGGGSAAAFKDQARDAMPDKSSVTMKNPGGGGSTGAGVSDPRALTATSNDPFFALTVSVAATFNIPVAAFLDEIANLTAVEPTSCTQTSCTWGPGEGVSSFNHFKLIVTGNQNGTSFEWTLSAEPLTRSGAGFRLVASGVAKPSGTPHHGSGSFNMDFYSLAPFNGPRQTGFLFVTSYSNVGPAQLAVTYIGAPDGSDTTQFDDLNYIYAEDASGGGDLQFALKNQTPGNNVSVHSRWKTDGSGRADLQGTAGAFALQDSDCWGPAPFAQVYFTSSAPDAPTPFGGQASGSVSSCAFST